MKLSAALSLTMVVRSIAVLGQGVLNFANFGNGVDAPVIDWDGTNKLSGPTFVADLYWAPGKVTSWTALSALGQPAVFDTNGYFFGGIRSIPNATAGATITCQVRVWDYRDGNSWAAAATVLGAKIGQSSLIQVVLAGGANAAPSLIGMMPFQTASVTVLDDPGSWLDPVPLTVTQDPDTLVFTWPPWKGTTVGGTSGNVSSFVLQQNSDPSGSNWVTLTNLPLLNVSGSTMLYQVITPKPNGAMFYRLVSRQ